MFLHNFFKDFLRSLENYLQIEEKRIRNFFPGKSIKNLRFGSFILIQIFLVRYKKVSEKLLANEGEIFFLSKFARLHFKGFGIFYPLRIFVLDNFYFFLIQPFIYNPTFSFVKHKFTLFLKNLSRYL